MTTISVDNPVVTLINVFTVAPDRQQELAEALSAATEKLFMTIDGFVSANIHTSLDGTRVVNYAQWASEQQHAQMQQLPEAREHMAEIMTIAESFDPRLFTVHGVHHRAD